ncbi:MAG: CBS domain-containing protein [Oscillospiraceae bacterium]|nr:CBS domain-containing protein [Oscillospiraceae bacterium]
MNIAFFLTLKKDVAYLYDDYTIRQSLEKMKRHGYSSIPVISRDGKYVSTVTEGDFLWYMLDESVEDTDGVSIYDAEELRLRDIIKKKDRFTAVRITASMEELIELAMNQNFVPVVDDMGTFIGIITRRVIIQYFAIKAFDSESELKPPSFSEK